MGREVAIKISAERLSDRFERESRIIASLNHPNICTFVRCLTLGPITW
jgi:hypothetical protein